MWTQIFEDNRDMKGYNEATGAFDIPSPTNGRYSIFMTLTPEDFKKLKLTGSYAAKNSKFDDDGNDVVKFGRNHEHRNFKGELMDWASGPPKVVKADGTPWSFEDDGAVGNGSICEVEVTTYTTSKATGTRLEKVKVIIWVEEVIGEPVETEEVPF